MQSIGQLLDNRQPEEPPEIEIIKEFMRVQFNVAPKITVQTSSIVIAVDNASLAGALRPHLHQIAAMCETTKKLIIRIGQ